MLKPDVDECIDGSTPPGNQGGADAADDPTSRVCWCCGAEGESAADGSTSLLGCDTLAGQAGEKLFAECTKPVRGCGEQLSCQRGREGWDCTLPASGAG